MDCHGKEQSSEILGEKSKKKNKWKSASWSFSHLVREMKISVSLPLAENARDEGGYSRFVLLDTPRAERN